ncbi:hypothetical protein ACHAXT_005750 [Thalassiosira profunda]
MTRNWDKVLRCKWDESKHQPPQTLRPLRLLLHLINLASARLQLSRCIARDWDKGEAPQIAHLSSNPQLLSAAMDLLNGYSNEDSDSSDDDIPLGQLISKASKSSPPTNRKGFGKGRATITYENEGVYEGDVIDGKVGGKCKFTYSNGSVYEGDWGDDEPNGRGKMKCADGDANGLGVYEGEWKHGMRHGQGKRTCASGSVYEGEWMTDKMHGKGKMKFKGGSVYEGEWKGNRRNGKGKGTYPNGDMFNGDWVDDEPHGEGTMKWANGDEEYVGEWEKGEMHGKGKFTHSNGDVYEGEYANDEAKGQGKMKYSNGDLYEGEWAGDEPNGRGRLMGADRARYTGEWKDGERHGAGTFKDADGTEYKQEYCNGELLLSSKRVAILIHGPPSQLQRTNETVGVVVLNDEEMRCGICGEDYSFKTDSADEDAKKRLPVISSCDHTCCHGCILKWQVSRAETNNGRVAKRVPCMLCKKSSAICPSEPKYNRMLIDFLGRCFPVKEQESE